MDAQSNVMMEGAMPSVIRDSLESNQKEQMLSSEDLAWVDSCLVPDSEVPECSWSSVRDALLDVLSSQPVSELEASVSVASGSSVEGTEQFNSSATLENIFSTEGVSYSKTEEADEGDEQESNTKKEAIDAPRYERALLPTYKEGVRESGIVEEDTGFVLEGNESEPSVDEIFKVSELESPSEEVNLVEQLNKALKSFKFARLSPEETPYETLPLIADDSAAWKDIKDVSLDNLIAGIADLSLSQFSG